jgi:cell division protein FtsB
MPRVFRDQTPQAQRPHADDVIAEMEATIQIARIVAQFNSSVVDRIFRHIEGARDENDKLRARSFEE